MPKYAARTDNYMKLISERPTRNEAPPQRAAVQQEKAKKVKRPKKAPSPESENRGRKAVLIVAICVVVLCGAFFGVGAYANGKDTIFNKVYLEGVALEGLTESQAEQALLAAGLGSEEDRTLTVNMPAGYTVEISAKAAGCFVSAAEAADFVYNACHGSSFFENTINYIRCTIAGMNLTVGDCTELNEEYVRQITNKAAKDTALALMDTEIEIGETEISVIKGASAVVIDENALYDMVKKALENGEETLSYTPEQSGPAKEINMQELYDTIFAEPVNSEYDPVTMAATEHVTGRSIDIAQAQGIWDKAQNGSKVVIPLIITEPELTKEKLDSMLFSDVLAQKTTYFRTSSYNRINNITLAAASFNGMVLNPGEEFSYNKVVGERTTAAGYLPAGAYSGGEVVSEVGGGICQVSSTLYYCTVLSNLEITSRTCHYFGVDYLPAGMDATVSWGGPEFKFKNNSEYPIKIVTEVDKNDKSLTVKIFGSNPEGIRVDLRAVTWSVAGGFAAQTYRMVYDKDGNLISEKEEARSTYHYHVDPSPSPSPSAEPTPSPSAQPSPSVQPSPSTPPTDTPQPTAPVEPTVAPLPETTVDLVVE